MNEEVRIPIDQVHVFNDLVRASALIADLQQQLDAANQRIAELEDSITQAGLLLSSPRHCWSDSIDKSLLLLRKALAQIAQPQDTPAEPATDYREIGREMAENRYANLVHAANRGVKCREALESLISLCNERGLTVGYGDHGQVTLSDETVLESLAREHHREVAPTQQLPGEDPPFDACRCPACVTVRAKSRSKS